MKFNALSTALLIELRAMPDAISQDTTVPAIELKELTLSCKNVHHSVGASSAAPLVRKLMRTKCCDAAITTVTVRQAGQHTLL